MPPFLHRMKQDRRLSAMGHRKKPCKMDCLRNNRIWCTSLSVLAGLVAAMICISCFSVLMTKMDAPDLLISCMACLALCVGSFTTGYVAARQRRRHGFLIGLSCGLVMYCIIFLTGIVILRSFACAGTPMKLLLIILCSGIGGIVGVNSKMRRPPR